MENKKISKLKLAFYRFWIEYNQNIAKSSTTLRMRKRAMQRRLELGTSQSLGFWDLAEI